MLNAVLKNEPDERIAVIVNEYGDQGLDHDLIETSVEELILLQSRCLRCSLPGELSNTVRELVKRRGRVSFF